MPNSLLCMNEWVHPLSKLSKYKRTIVYGTLLLLVAIGHHCSRQTEMETFRYVRHSVMSMLCLLCLSGFFVLMRKKKRVRADLFFAFLMLSVGITNLLSLTRGLTAGYAGVVEYRYMSFPMLVYGNLFAYFFLLYPIEAFRPGWLTLKRATILFLPTILILGVYLVATRILGVTIPVIDDWSSLIRGFWNITVWLRLFILFYPVFGLMVMLRYRNNYREWCENNYASMEHIDSRWLEDYIFGNLVITISCLVVVFSNDARSVLAHNIIFLSFFLYAFYRVFFQKNPYPEGYFKAGMKETAAVIDEIVACDKECLCKEGETGLIVIPEQDSGKKSLFSNKLPEYREKLEQWMETEKPHLRKDFKLIDAMEILPLNRSYLSRLFNEGYNESFYQFVMRYRIAESKRLLITRPDLTITRIAEMSGFSSPSVFGRAFTQEMKCSPMQWRDRETANSYSTGTIEIA